MRVIPAIAVGLALLACSSAPAYAPLPKDPGRVVACCAHHLADVLPIVGLSGLAVFLVEFRTPLMLLGIATNVVGIVVMLLQLRRIRGGYRLLSRRGAMAV